MLAVIQAQFRSTVTEKGTLADLSLWTDWWHLENYHQEVVTVFLFTISVACLHGFHLLHE